VADRDQRPAAAFFTVFFLIFNLFLKDFHK
jgi:hypothetical protein